MCLSHLYQNRRHEGGIQDTGLYLTNSTKVVKIENKLKCLQKQMSLCNNLGSDQVRHKPVCTVTEAGKKLELSDLKRRIVLSMLRKQRR